MGNLVQFIPRQSGKSDQQFLGMLKQIAALRVDPKAKTLLIVCSDAKSLRYTAGYIAALLGSDAWGFNVSINRFSFANGTYIQLFNSDTSDFDRLRGQRFRAIIDCDDYALKAQVNKLIDG